ncbi:MAG: PaaI family thioesterase [Archangiaceae bacterium]|nr:PaaI family thioesterase [Archangiaceae bacterium]
MLPHHLDGSLFGADQPCFGCSPNHPSGFHLKLVRDGEGVKTLFTPHDKYQGPPGVMHGGLVMTLADEVAAWAILAKIGKFGFTTSFEGKFRAPVRVGQEAQGFGRVVKESSRVVRVQVRIEQNGAECFDGLLTFVLLDRAGAEKLMGRPLPDAWAQFAR